MPRRKKLRPLADSEEEFRQRFLALDAQLQANPYGVKSLDHAKRLEVLAGYCLGISLDFTAETIQLLIPPDRLNDDLWYLSDDDEPKAALGTAIKAFNLKMTEILLDMGASLDQCGCFDGLWPLDHLIDASDSVRTLFLQAVCQKRGTTDLFVDSAKGDGIGVGHLLAALQLSSEAVNNWTPEVCSHVVSRLWSRLSGESLDSDRELLVIMYASGKVRIDDMINDSCPGWSALNSDLRCRNLDVLKFMLRTLKADPEVILGSSSLAIDAWSAPQFFELVLNELFDAGLGISVLIDWVFGFLRKSVLQPFDLALHLVSTLVKKHDAAHGVQVLYYVWYGIQMQFRDCKQSPKLINGKMASLWEIFVSLSLARDELVSFAVFKENRLEYAHSDVFALWKIIGVSVPDAASFISVIKYSAYLTFGRLVWMFGKDCPINEISPETVEALGNLSGKAASMEKRSVVALVRIMLRSTQASATWFPFLKKVMEKKNVSIDNLLEDRMKLSTIAASALNDSIRKHPLNVKPPKIRRLVFAEDEFAILEKFGKED